MTDAVELELEKIRLDGGTQVRVEIDEPTVQRYREIIDEGGVLDPIQVLHDGSDYWPWDGFHRIHATRGAGRPVIMAHVIGGTRKDAIRRALSANKKHGKPLTTADRINAIRIALREFPEMSDRSIASEIGTSHSTVAKYRPDAGATGQIGQSNKRTGADGRTINVGNIGKKQAVTSPSGSAATPPPAARPINIDDIPLDMPAPAPATSPAEPPAAQPLDEAGNVLTSQAMIDDFARRGEITKLMQAISEVKTTVAAAVERQDPLYLGLNTAAFDANCTNLYRRLSTLRPHAICPYCGGDGCKTCYMRGWVGKDVYDAAPDDGK